MVLNKTLGQMDFIGIYQKLLSQKGRIHILFKCTRNILQIDHPLGHQINLNILKTKIISSIFTEHNHMKLKSNYQKKWKKTQTRWGKTKWYKHQRIDKEIKQEKKTWRQMKMKTGQLKIWGCSKSSSKRNVYNDICVPQEWRKTLNNPTVHLKGLGKKEKTKHKVKRRKEMINIRLEINKIDKDEWH